jgi:putative ABC transport system permease protein
VYYHQMRFIQTKDLGYNANEVIQTQIPGDREIMPVYHRIRAGLSSSPSIKAVSFGGGESVYEVQMTGKSIQAIHKVIDEHYLGVMGIPLRTGRNLSPAFSTDSSRAVLVNEAFVKAARLENPIGTTLRTSDYFDKVPKTIVGVIKDFHTGSLRQSIQPMVLFMSGWFGGSILVKLEKKSLKEGMAALENVYKAAIPNAVYQYRFLVDINKGQYEQEQRWQKIISLAAALSIIICSLGLFGLASLATRQREKEIGIRKVLGATVAQVAVLLSGSFLKLVLIAISIAIPAGWFVMNRWLEDFAYRIHPDAGIFIAAAVVALAVALAAVILQAVKTAVANPVKALRSE